MTSLSETYRSVRDTAYQLGRESAQREAADREADLHRQYSAQMAALEAEIKQLVRVNDAVLAEREAIWNDGYRAGLAKQW